MRALGRVLGGGAADPGMQPEAQGQHAHKKGSGRLVQCHVGRGVWSRGGWHVESSGSEVLKFRGLADPRVILRVAWAGMRRGGPMSPAPELRRILGATRAAQGGSRPLVLIG